MSPADALDAERLAQAVRGQQIGNRIVVLDEATSTNDVVFAMAPDNAEGLVVFAERQTAGRGQHGRRWESARGKGLWFSVLLQPGITPEESPRLTSWAARTVAETIAKALDLPTTVKPPNDVYIGDRKAAGVLLEMRAVPSAPHLGILGIGLNVNQTADDFPEELRATATSLSLTADRRIDRHEIATALLRDLDRTYPARKKRL
jgi:BirA family biotin operon repressor/biotin-[acetyl-CoA-carboxylase] ligase